MYLVLSAFTFIPVSLVATTKTSASVYHYNNNKKSDIESVEPSTIAVCLPLLTYVHHAVALLGSLKPAASNNNGQP
jgi:hypothetical protein